MDISMNYDEIPTGTEFTHITTGMKIKFLDDVDNKVLFASEDKTGSMYKTYFERYYEIAKNAHYNEGEEDES